MANKRRSLNRRVYHPQRQPKEFPVNFWGFQVLVQDQIRSGRTTAKKMKRNILRRYRFNLASYTIDEPILWFILNRMVRFVKSEDETEKAGLSAEIHDALPKLRIHFRR